ncbi:MAG TPA: hypothetical protein VFQ53_01925 [Kofleriaceae bacterium]|nr:hypothetical protein [Kofleriaceae bacterium]
MRIVVIAILLVSASVAAADDARPTIVFTGVAGTDPAAERASDAATAAIQKAAARSKRYRAIGTPKQIFAAVQKAECKAMATPCAVAIGKAMAADYVLAGELERRGTHNILTLALVNVATKQRVRSVRDNTGATVNAGKRAQLAYQRVVDTETGELVLAANASRGEVYIDGVSMAALFEGRVTISGLALGAHQVAIRAPGYKPLDVELVVDGSSKHVLMLEPVP